MNFVRINAIRNYDDVAVGHGYQNKPRVKRYDADRVHTTTHDGAA